MAYELWSMASRNALGEFASETEALAAVRAEVAAGGEAYATALALLYANSRGRSRVVAQGEALVERAKLAALAERAPARQRTATG
jgi:hypothetical protein